MSNSSPLAMSGEVRVVLTGKEFDRSREFYEKVIGLKVINEWGRGAGDRGVIYDIAGTNLELLEGEAQAVSGNFYIYIAVPDADALYAKLSGSVQIVDPIATQPWKHRNFSVRDPNGFKIKFFTVLP